MSFFLLHEFPERKYKHLLSMDSTGENGFKKRRKKEAETELEALVALYCFVWLWMDKWLYNQKCFLFFALPLVHCCTLYTVDVLNKTIFNVIHSFNPLLAGAHCSIACMFSLNGIHSCQVMNAECRWYFFEFFSFSISILWLLNQVVQFQRDFQFK